MLTGTYEDEETKTVTHGSKKSNVLPLWGNERSMNLNALILTNIQSSHYFKGKHTRSTTIFFKQNSTFKLVVSNKIEKSNKNE